MADEEWMEFVLDEIESVVEIMDEYVRVWGDEGVLRRCRQRLAALLEQRKDD